MAMQGEIERSCREAETSNWHAADECHTSIGTPPVHANPPRLTSEKPKFRYLPKINVLPTL